MRTFALSTGLALAACGPGGSDTDTTVLLREAARILDADSQAALSAFDPDRGTLRFGAAPAQVAQLDIGQVLVSSPTPAAPLGLLRKVTAVRQEGADTVVDTAPAELYEVIREGGFATTFDLDPVNLIAPPDPGPARWEAALGHVLYDIDDNPATTGDQVRVSGQAFVGAGWNIAWKVFDVGGLFDDLNPFDAIDLEVEVGASISEDVSLVVQLPASGALDREIEAFTYWFQPVVIFVGPVPVTLNPRFTLHLGVSGTGVGAASTFGLHQWFNASAGAQCSVNDGCGAWGDFDPGIEANVPPPDLSAVTSGSNATRVVWARATVDLLVYAAAGPFGEIKPFGRFVTHVPGKPAWTLDGGVYGRAGIHALGFSYGADIFEDEWPIAEASNTPPSVALSLPSDGAQVQLHVPTLVQVTTHDLEDGYGCCTPSVTSSVDGPLGPLNAYRQVEVSFATPGPRVLTATATDSDGATRTDSITVTVLNTPPDVTLAQPLAGSAVPRGLPILLRGYVTDANEPGGKPPCAGVLWGGGLEGDLLPADHCGATAAGVVAAQFATNGPRTLTLSATDSLGGIDSQSVAITVVDPPADVLPDLVLVSPELQGLQITTTTVSQVQLAVHVFDADDASLSLTWRVGWPCTIATPCANDEVILSTPLNGTNYVDLNGINPPGVFHSHTWSPLSTLATPGCGGSYDGVLEVDVSDGTQGRGFKIPIHVSKPPC